MTSLAALARQRMRSAPALPRDLARYDWSRIARPNQLEPEGDWSTWLIMAGRGWGKTRTGAEWVRHQVESSGARRIALVARTSADARDVIVEGDSGILAISPPWFRPVYEPSKRRLTWPNGAIGTLYSADEPKLLRGPQHDAAWADELATWPFKSAWDNLLLGLRLGKDPRVVVTTTPEPIPLIRTLHADPTTVLSRGSTYENAANLSPKALATFRRLYEGTRLGRQELYGEILDDAPGALFKRERIDELRVDAAPCGFVRVVVAIDPAVTVGEDADETGLVVVAVGEDGHGYVLADASGRYLPHEWAAKAVALYRDYRADCLVAESNQGGLMVESTLRTHDAGVPVLLVHASRGKHARAEPISLLYEQGRVHHVGSLPELEDQLCSWQPGAKDSPDRLDALVHGLSDLLPLLRRYDDEPGPPLRKPGELGYVASGPNAWEEREADRLGRIEAERAEAETGYARVWDAESD